MDTAASAPLSGGPGAGTRLRQAGIVALGLVLAAAMVVLGVWQLDVYHSQGQDAAQSRVDEAAGWSLGKMCADLVRAAATRGNRRVAAAQEV